MRALTLPKASFSSYSRLREVAPRELRIASDASDIAESLRYAEAAGRRLTFRAAGRSFDDQALNDDMLVDVSRLDQILSLDLAKREITVQAGARWGDILNRTLVHGLVPHILVTTSHATAGGTLSANCISRSSPRYGHTGDHVRSLKLLTVAGEQLDCSREENAAIFHAAIGGFGWFGVVLEVTFDLLEIGPRQRVRSIIERREGLAPFVELLIERSLTNSGDDAVYSVYSLAAPQRGAVFSSSYCEEPVGRTLFLYEGPAWYRTPAEFLFTSSWLSKQLCQASYLWAFTRGPFIDDLRGYTFCMEGNERAKAATERFGVKLTSMQHSYTVPAGSLLWFLEETARSFAKHDVYPALLDSLYLPADAFLLSSSRGAAGFCSSFIFEGITPAKYGRVHRCFLELNDICIAAGGRLHLVKNVFTKTEQLRAMYAGAVGELELLKSKLDPRGVLVNDFYKRAFG